MDYYNTVLIASDAVEQANSLVDSMEALLASPDWQKQMPVALKLAAGVESQGEELVTHAFVYGAALILVFFVALFLTLVGYRYVSKRLEG